MYKITKTSDSFEVKGIKDGIDPDFNLTYLEIEIRNTVENSIDKDLSINVDQQMLNTIFRNLLSNAVKFTPRGGIIEIGNKSNQSDHSHVIFVKDTGIGIPEDKIPKLFAIDQKVSRLGTEGEPSTGLGLLLCKEYIEKHNGKIWIESEEDKGTTFNFSIIPTI